MNDDFSVDPIDAELRRRFDAAGNDVPDPDRVLESLRPAFRRARTRRRAAVGGSAALVAVAALVVGLSIGGAGTTTVHTPPATNGSVPHHTLEAPPTTVSRGDQAGGEGNNGGEVSAPVNQQPRSTPNESGTTPAPGPAATVPANGEPTPPTTALVVEQSYSSPGGSITVRFADGVVSLVSFTPAPGYTAEVHDNGPDRVEVRFNNGQTEWRIRVDVVNGSLVPEITQN